MVYIGVIDETCSIKNKCKN